MRFCLFIVLIFSSYAHAGYFLEKSMYVETFLAIGRAPTLNAARADALSAIPAPSKWLWFEINSQYASPAVQCVGGGVWTEQKECLGGDVQYILPLRKIEQ